MKEGNEFILNTLIMLGIILFRTFGLLLTIGLSLILVRKLIRKDDLENLVNRQIQEERKIWEDILKLDDVDK